MRVGFVTLRSDLRRIMSFEPDAFVLLDPVEVDGKVLEPEELGDIMIAERAPFGILDGNFSGSLEVREEAFERRPRFVIYKDPDDPGFARIDGITFVNASRGAVIDGRAYVPVHRRKPVLYTLKPETPRRIPKDLADLPARVRAYREYSDPHRKRLAMFARAYMERRVLVRMPEDASLVEALASMEPVFFDLEFDARALRRGFKPEGPIIRVASVYDGKLRKFFVRDLDGEREFLEFLSGYEAIIGYGTSGDARILRRAAERHNLPVPRIVDLREALFPRDPRKQRIAVPSGRKTGLKAVAEALGFRRSSDKDGLRAFRAYLYAKRHGRPRRIVRELVRYNVEDTLMTRFVYYRSLKAFERLVRRKDLFNTLGRLKRAGVAQPGRARDS